LTVIDVNYALDKISSSPVRQLNACCSHNIYRTINSLFVRRSLQKWSDARTRCLFLFVCEKKRRPTVLREP